MEPTANKKILIVDDDQPLRESLREVLTDEGWEAVVASDGREALDLLARDEPPCLILLDLMMPNMNGWQFRAAQLEDPQIAGICTLVMTANLNLLAESPLRVDHVVRKPIALAPLLDLVAECCGPPR